MYTQRLYIGLNDKDTHKQEFPKDCAVKLITNTLKRFAIHNFTLVEAKGYWLSKAEDTLIVIFSATNREYLIPKDAIEALKVILNQDYIMQEIQEVAGEFI